MNAISNSNIGIKEQIGNSFDGKIFVFGVFGFRFKGNRPHCQQKKTTPARTAAGRPSLMVLKINIINFQKPERTENSITIVRI